jgi:pimeloyl-ACP methyl ester carboxylesterase
MTKEQRQQASALRSESLGRDVAAIETPTLLLRGAISKILSEDAANAMTEAMPDCTHVVIEGAGHSVQGDQPAAMVAALDAFLSERLGDA